jgi:hypothetical protein
VVAARIGLEHRLVAVDAPAHVTFERFDAAEIVAAARAAMPGVTRRDETWLTWSFC